MSLVLPESLVPPTKAKPQGTRHAKPPIQHTAGYPGLREQGLAQALGPLCQATAPSADL